MPSVETNVVEQEVKINARPETVYSYLVDEEKLRRWMSIGGAWLPKPGDPYRLIMTKEDVAVGKFVEVVPPTRLVFTWGWEGEDAITKPGSSTVEITLRRDGDGTIVRLVHRDLPTADSAVQHGHGWEHYLGRLAIAGAGGDPGPDKFQE
ncbi:MAG TPA: SRPBCC domain-containing protein [Candidatus Eremiobacteraceae bacterium]|nr:SRPBCC domain-containing protein [Candidatus Eremiobacteraceae bacterium]